MENEANKIQWLADFLKEIENTTVLKAKENELPEAEQEYADALLRIVAKYGKLANGDGNGIWVGYTPAKENDNKKIGVKCQNCYFYEGGNDCSIVAQAVEPGGLCRLAAIPDGIVRKMK
jgi:hypothetical protein